MEQDQGIKDLKDLKVEVATDTNRTSANMPEEETETNF